MKNHYVVITTAAIDVTIAGSTSMQWGYSIVRHCGIGATFVLPCLLLPHGIAMVGVTVLTLFWTVIVSAASTWSITTATATSFQIAFHMG